MKCCIECSYGEVIDKLTILTIKLMRVEDPVQKRNIQKEYDKLVPMARKDDESYDALFQRLLAVNKKLWMMEDFIRMKSSKREFDQQYLACAEGIHRTNDERYGIKRQINRAFKSEIVEEKIYKGFAGPADAGAVSDVGPAGGASRAGGDSTGRLSQAKACFKNGDYGEAERLLRKVADAEDFEMNKKCAGDTRVSMHILLEAQNRGDESLTQLAEVAEHAGDYFPDKAQADHARLTYGRALLRRGDYAAGFPYYKYANVVRVQGGRHRVCPDTMSYLGADDSGRTQLVYASGGLGDAIMFARFVKPCVEAAADGNNRVVFLVCDPLRWIFEELCSGFAHAVVVPESQRDRLPPYEHHTNIAMLGVFLGFTDKDYLEFRNPFLCRMSSRWWQPTLDVDEIIDPDRLNVAINWHGNYANAHERHRGMDLKALSPLFDVSGVSWLCVQKEVIPEDAAFLREKGIRDLSDVIDNAGDAFRDTIELFRKVDLVISTDTSILHVAGSGATCAWGMLTFSAEWRWGGGETAPWYPSVRLFRQTKIGDWVSVVQRVKAELARKVACRSSLALPVSLLSA